jgi:hypothetical protein
MYLFNRILIAACCVLISFGYVSLSRGAEWKFFYQSEVEQKSRTITQKLYYDISSIEKPQKGIVKVTQKATQVVAGEAETDLKTWLVELNCSSRKFRYLSVKEYEEGTEKVISEERSDNASWVRFSLESVIAALYDNVCFEKKQPKQPEKKPEK